MATTWTLDPTHSELEFRVKHMMISNVKGAFKKFNVVVDGDDFTTAPITATAQLDSIDTNNADRDKHLLAQDFFDVAQFPQMEFKSTAVKKISDDNYKITGDLTPKGITKPITLDVEYGGTNKNQWGQEKAGFTVDGKMNRKDWGISFNAAMETGGVMLGEEVKIHGDIQLVKS